MCKKERIGKLMLLLLLGVIITNLVITEGIGGALECLIECLMWVSLSIVFALYVLLAVIWSMGLGNNKTQKGAEKKP